VRKSGSYSSRDIADHLAERIHTGRLPVGSGIPSIRALAAQFAASFATARNAVQLLCDEGLVERRHGSGAFVRKRNGGPRRARRVAVLLHGNHFWVGIYSTVFLGIQKAAEAKDVSLLVEFSSKKAWSERAAEILEQADGAILLGADEYGDAYKQFPLNNPIVALCTHDSNEGRISVVDLDPCLAAEQAVAFFKKRKLRTVAVVSAAGPAFVNRGTVFASAWRTQGGEVEFHRYPRAIAFEPGKGYLFTTHSVLQTYSDRVMAKTGKPLSATATVLGIDGKNRIDPASHPAPTIDIDWQLVGACAFDELLSRIEHPGSVPKRIYLPGNLCEA
jgi:DNA-binding LacI/PurR family transcriptional regulator